MASVITVHITGEDQLSGTLNKAQASLKAFEQGVLEGAKAEVAAHQATQKSTQVYTAFTDATGKLAISQRNLGAAVTIVGSQVAGLGPIASLASNAITTMAFASGPAGIALGALATVIGVLMYRIQQARDRMRELSEIELAQLARDTKALNLENDIKRRVEVLRSSKPEIAEITQRYRELRIELEKAGARPQALANADQARNLEIAAVRKKEAETAAEKARQAQEREARAIDTARDSIVSQIEAVRLQTKSLEDGEVAAAEYAISQLAGSDAVRLLGKEGLTLVGILREERLALIASNQERERQAQLAKSAAEGIAARGEVLERQMQEENSLLQEQLNLTTRLAEQRGNFELQKLRAAGRPENEVLQRQLDILREQESQIRNAPQITTAQNTEQARLREEIELTETRLAQFGKVSINVGHAVADTMADIAHGIATGTLKGFDVVRAAGASALNLVTDVFRQTLQQKLSFEVSLLTNMRGLPAQMNGALSAGAAAVPGGQPGGGGFLSSILGFGGGGGTSGGGIFSGFGSLFGGNPAGVSGPLMQNGQFFSNPFGALLGNGQFSFGGAGLGAGIGLLMSLLTGGFSKGSIGSTIGSTVGGIGGSFFGPIGSVIGSMLGSLIGGLFNSTPNPTVNVRSQLEGIIYDSLANEFQAGSVKTRASGVDISGSAVTQTKNQVQQLLEGFSEQWTDILNLFPAIVHDRMIPTLAAANERLNRVFRNLKFSEGGSRSIAEELADLQGVAGPRRFFLSLRQTLGTGIGESLRLGGFENLLPLVGAQFPLAGRGASGTGLNPPRGAKALEAFVQSIAGFASLTSSLATIGGPGGVGQFLTEQDRARLEGGIADVLKVRQGKQFTTEVEQLQKRIQPITDFLNQAVQQSTDLFGRGMIAALDAASGSAALRNFNQLLGEGVKQTIFEGITQSFLASAQFNDLLAPLQKTIRDFTQEALATGQRPDIDAFRRAILPQIEGIASRADLLEEIIRELQKLGLTVKGELSDSGLGGGGGVHIESITINGNVDSRERVDELTRGIASLLRGKLSPPT